MRVTASSNSSGNGSHGWYFFNAWNRHCTEHRGDDDAIFHLCPFI
jgi:hypothetical protein